MNIIEVSPSVWVVPDLIVAVRVQSVRFGDRSVWTGHIGHASEIQARDVLHDDWFAIAEVRTTSKMPDHLHSEEAWAWSDERKAAHERDARLKANEIIDRLAAYRGTPPVLVGLD